MKAFLFAVILHYYYVKNSDSIVDVCATTNSDIN